MITPARAKGMLQQANNSTKRGASRKNKEKDMNDLTRYKLTAGLPVPAGAKLIYCYLLDVSDRRGIAISVRQLGKSIGLSRSATRKNLHRLKHMDMLDITPRYSEDGGRLSNRYRLK
jgi:response regulator of citrate/malate metabolism